MLRESVSVVLPCYNEEDSVERIVRSTRAVLGEITEDFEIIVVDDGSRDRTGEIAGRLAETCAEVKVVRHPRRRGYGNTLRSGFRAAGKELIFYTDGDGQFDVAELRRLLFLLPEADIVTGYRKRRQDPFYRVLNSRLYNLAVRALFAVKVRDVNCAFKLYRRKVLKDMRLDSAGAFINAEIIIKAARRGCRIRETGVSHYPRTSGRPTGARPGVILTAAREMLMMRGRKSWRQMPE